MRKLAIGIAATALSVAAIVPVKAEGFWFGGPGFGIGVGFGPSYAYDYPAYGYTSVGYWGAPARNYTYATYSDDDWVGYAPGVTVGYGYEPAYYPRYSTARYHHYRQTYRYPERVSYRLRYAYAPHRTSSRHFAAVSGRQRFEARSTTIGSTRLPRSARSRVSSEGVHVRGGQFMARGSQSELKGARVRREH